MPTRKWRRQAVVFGNRSTAGINAVTLAPDLYAGSHVSTDEATIVVCSTRTHDIAVASDGAVITMIEWHRAPPRATARLVALLTAPGRGQRDGESDESADTSRAVLPGFD